MKKKDAPKGVLLYTCDEVRCYMVEPAAARCILISTFSVRPE